MQYFCSWKNIEFRIENTPMVTKIVQLSGASAQCTLQDSAQYAWQMIPARQEKVNIECLQMLPFSHTIYHLTKHQTPLHSIFQSVLVSNHNDGGSLF